MDRSLYPEGVEVHQSDLKNTEDSRSFHIVRRHIDNTFPGVVSGLIVTPNTGNPALIDVAGGYGYTPNGEFAELESGVTAVALANSSTGVENLVALVYTETNDRPQPHETSGDSLPTRANHSVRLRVFTRSQYDVLPESDDNLDNDARDRTLIVASITAQGSGVSIPSSAIELPPIFGSAINIANLTNNITGVTITSAEAGTANGNGSIEFNFNNGTLTWIAPDDSTGNPVNVLDGGFFELESFPSNKTLTVFVSSAILPISNQTDTIQVQNLYYEDAPRHSANDIHHRSLVGSGVPTPNNPHGLTLSDLGISGTPIEEHQTLMHSNGIRRDSDVNTLLAIVNTGASPDELSITVAPNFYVYLRGTLFVSSNQTAVPFTDVVDNTQILFEVFAKNGPNSQTDIEKRERVRFDALGTLTNYVQLRDMSTGTGAGAGSIVFYTASDTLVYTAPGDSAGPARAIPGSGSEAMRLFSDNGIDYIDVLVSSSLSTYGDQVGNLTVSDRPTTNELKDRLQISTVMFSGSATGFLGNGFGVNNAPNEALDKRLFGTTAPNDLRDDALLWILGETDEAQSPAGITTRQLGIIDPNYDGPNLFNTYAKGVAQVSIFGKAHVLGRSAEQYGIFNAIQYSTPEDGLKQGIRNDLITDFGSGTMPFAMGIMSLMRHQHSGIVTSSSALWGRVDVEAGANVSYAAGLNIQSPAGGHAAATEIGTLYGILVDDQDRGSTNWAIKTGLGRVGIGDELRFTAGDGIEYDQPATIGVVNQFRYYSWFRQHVNAIIDGSTSPGDDGHRVSLVEAYGSSTTLNDFITSDMVLSNQALLFEICDANTVSPDGRIIFAGTGNDGIVDPLFVIQGDGHVGPGIDSAYTCGTTGSRWSNVYTDNVTVTDDIDVGDDVRIVGGLRVGSGTTNPAAGEGIFSDGITVGYDGAAGAAQVRVGDVDFRMDFNSGNPRIEWGPGDFMTYDRTPNRLTLPQAGPTRLPYLTANPTDYALGDVFAYQRSSVEYDYNAPTLRYYGNDIGGLAYPDDFARIRHIHKHHSQIQNRTTSGEFTTCRYAIDKYALEANGFVHLVAMGYYSGNTGSVYIGTNIGMSGSDIWSPGWTASSAVWHVEAWFVITTMGTLASPGTGWRWFKALANTSPYLDDTSQNTAEDGSYTQVLRCSISAAASVTVRHCEWEMING